MEFLDNIDKQCVINAILLAIKELAKMETMADQFGIGTMMIKDTMIRYQRLLKNLTEPESDK